MTIDRACVDKIGELAPGTWMEFTVEEDPKTWVLHFDQQSTPEQQDAVRAYVAAYAPATPGVPATVTPYQARMALLNSGRLDQIEALMADPSTPQAAKIAWEYATVWERNSAFIGLLGPALGLSSAEIDDLFRAAAAVN